LFAALFAGLGLLSLRAEVPTEYRVKAAFLFNFTKFVEWPPERFPGRDAPIVIAVLGRNPFGPDLENIVRDRLVNGRPIRVRLLASAAEARAEPTPIHILFVAAGEEQLLADTADAPACKGALTVGESSRFAALGGVVNFVVLENRVHFEISRAGTATASIKISAQLQRLAQPARFLRLSTPP